MAEKLSFNKVIGIEDFSDPELRAIIRDVFQHEIPQFPPEYPDGVPDSKHWEIAMRIRALRHFGAIRPDSVILGLGAGTEVTSFYLTNHVRQVFATDLYMNAGVRADVAPYHMLVEPEAFAPCPFDRNRLVVQHMDGRLLEYPDNLFDGIFSAGSIEYFGSLDFIANAAYEMGRVLKPGGVLALATNFKISGPPDADGCGPDTFVLSCDRIERYIVEASGLDPVDSLDTSISEQTMVSKRDLLTFPKNTSDTSDYRMKVTNYPNLILVREGYVFCSVHLALQKTTRYPVTNNAWAKPSFTTLTAVEEQKQDALNLHIAPLRTGSAFYLDPASVPAGSSADIPPIAEVHAPQHLLGTLAHWEAVYNRAGVGAQSAPPFLRYFLRTYLRIRMLGRAWTAQNALYRGLVEWQLSHDPMIDSRVNDIIRSLHELGQAVRGRERRFDDSVKRLAAADRALRRRLDALDGMISRLDHELSGKLETLRHTVEALQALLDGMISRLDHELSGKLETLPHTVEALQALLDALDRRTRMNTSYIRLLRQQTTRAPGSQATAGLGWVTDILGIVEAQMPEVSQAKYVYVSVADATAEATLFEMTDYFGARAVAFDYSDCDVWFHLDLSLDWKTSEFFAGAREKLRDGARFAIITNEAIDEAPTAGFALERSLDVGPGFRAHILKRVE